MATAKKWENLYDKNKSPRENPEEVRAQVKQDLDKLRDKIHKDPEVAKKAAQVIEEMLRKEDKKEEEKK
jgi:ElaB/YqjD/DUF883 family membrane-anchored ribosome-binding protein